MSRVNHCFGELHRFGNGRPRLWLIRIDEQLHLYRSEQLARGELDIDLPHRFLRDSWRQLLKALLREYRWHRRDDNKSITSIDNGGATHDGKEI